MMDFEHMPWFLGNGPSVMSHWWGSGIVFFALWSIAWTGLALWHAAKREEKGWFIIFLLIHTAGILELIYLAFIVKIFSSPRRQSRKRS